MVYAPGLAGGFGSTHVPPGVSVMHPVFPYAAPPVAGSLRFCPPTLPFASVPGSYTLSNDAGAVVVPAMHTPPSSFHPSSVTYLPGVLPIHAVNFVAEESAAVAPWNPILDLHAAESDSDDDSEEVEVRICQSVEAHPLNTQ